MEKQEFTKGHFTLPSEAGKEDLVIELAKKWGVDAIRDSDGTDLSEGILSLGYQVYSTVCLVRADQEWPRKHKNMWPQNFLMSEPVVAVSETVSINPMETYFKEKYKIDINNDPKKWWEVIDRTTGEVVDVSKWDFIPGSEKVVIKNAKKNHLYTVNFLVYHIWDSTSMYNHMTNNWQREHVEPVNPYFPEVYAHMLEYLDKWIEQHPKTDVVRLTTLAYHFTLDSDQNGKPKYVDWLGYMDSVSPAMLEDFEKEKGYRLRSEDFVDGGYYNALSRVPSKKYLDWIDFVHRFVVKFGKDVVERIHKAGKRSAMFQGDHWIGVETFGPHYLEMKNDIDIGACECGVALRRVSDVPGAQIKEVRFYPYFFPDVFRPGGDPLGESISNWIKIRRAILRKPIDRIGYGGYLSLANQFPEFVKHVETISHEFRGILEHSKKTPAYTPPVKVAVLNCWGKLRSWLVNNTAPSSKFYEWSVISDFLECLSGLPVEVSFISFDDIKEKGIPEDIDVIINNGPADTAWSGGENWIDEKIVSSIREWVYNGGGFIGIEEPTAHEYQGRFFQLSDIFGVQKEKGYSISVSSKEIKPVKDHFMAKDISLPANTGIKETFVFVCDEKTEVLSEFCGHVLASAKEAGKGRGIFMSGLPYSMENSRFLHRAIFYACKKEDEMGKWFSSNVKTDCAAFPETNFFVVVNNSATNEETIVTDDKGKKINIKLTPYECKWLKVK